MVIQRSRTILFTVIVFSLLFALSCDTGPVQSDQITWERTFGDDIWQTGEAIVETTSGDLVIWANGENGPCLMKVELTGNLAWEVSLEGLVGQHAHALEATPDGGVVAAGDTWTDSTSYDARIVKVDRNGTVVWGQNINILGTERAFSIFSTAEGGVVVAGATLNEETEENSRPFLVKLNSDGEIIWKNDYTYPNLGTINIVIDVVPTTTGGYIIFGRTSLYVLRVNERGKMLWLKTITELAPQLNSHYHDYSSAAVIEPGRYVLAGRTVSQDNEGYPIYDGHLAIVDEDANLVSEQSFSNAPIDFLLSATATCDGGIVATGQTAVEEEDVTVHRIWLVKTNDNCAIRWVRLLDGFRGTGVAACRDGGIALTGWGYGVAGAAVYVARTNAHGDIDE